MKARELKPCACGVVPDKLKLALGEDWHGVYHDNKCRWMLSVDADDLTDDEAQDPEYDDSWAVKAWTDAPRAATMLERYLALADELEAEKKPATTEFWNGWHDARRTIAKRLRAIAEGREET